MKRQRSLINVFVVLLLFLTTTTFSNERPFHAVSWTPQKAPTPPQTNFHLPTNPPQPSAFSFINSYEPTPSMITRIKTVVMDFYEATRWTVEMISDFTVSSIEAALGTAMAAAGIAIGNSVSLGYALLSGQESKLQFAIKPTVQKLKDAWAAFKVNFADDFKTFNQQDRKPSITRSVLNILGQVPILGHAIGGARVHPGEVSALVQSQGIHIPAKTQSGRQQRFSTALQTIHKKPVINLKYKWGTITDVISSLLNIEHSASYGAALSFLKKGVATKGQSVILIGHSGGAARLAGLSKILGNLGVGVKGFIGVAGPVGGIPVPTYLSLGTRFNNIGEMTLLRGAGDLVSFIQAVFSRTPVLYHGVRPQENHALKGIHIEHQDLGGPGEDLYFKAISSEIDRFLEGSN